MQYYQTDARRVLTGGPYQITDLPSGAVVTEHVPPTPGEGEVVFHAGSGRWVVGPAPVPVVKTSPAPEVTAFEFLFELHHPIEQLVLDAVKTEASTLTAAQLLDPATDPSLVTIRNAYERLNQLQGGTFNTTSSATQAFFDAALAKGVYGPNDNNVEPGSEEAAQLRVATIKAGDPPPA